MNKPSASLSTIAQRMPIQGKRAILAGYDALSLLIVAAIICLANARPAWAYVDPSVMTYTIQALAGVAVALGAVAGVALRRTRKVIFKWLKIDENANKPIEPKVSRTTGRQNDEIDYIIRGNKAGKSGKSGSIGFFARLGVGALIGVFFAITAMASPSLELVWANANDLVFSFDDLAPIILTASVIIAAVIAIVLAILPGTAFRFASGVIFALGLCMYVQAMFMNNGIPAADGTSVDWWGSFGVEMVVSALVWAVLFVGIIVFVWKARTLSTRVFAILCVALIIVQGVGIGSLFAERSAVQEAQAANPETAPTSPNIITEDGLWEVSDKENVIVLVLDKFDTAHMASLVASNPAALSEFTGFTWYQDSVGVMIPTAFAIPYMLTASEPTGPVNVNYFRNRWTSSSFLSSIKNAGYHVGVYSSGLSLGYFSNDEISAVLGGCIDNIHPLGDLTPDAVASAKRLFECSCYRNAPWIFKDNLRYYTDDLNQDMLATGAAAASNRTPYVTDDAAYCETLETEGLTINTTYEKGAFRFIHLNGAHEPYTIDENGKKTKTATADQSALGAIHIASEYLKKLKELGVYDNSTIIICADHGDWYAGEGLPTYATSPIMFYKPAGAANNPVAISNAQITQQDLQPTVLSALGIPWQGTYNGYVFDQAPTSGRTRTSYQISARNGDVLCLYKYNIIGNASDVASWQYSGTSIPCKDYTGTYRETASDVTSEETEAAVASKASK